MKEFRKRIDELKNLKDGWNAGDGVAFDPEGLDWLAEMMKSVWDFKMLAPRVSPTPAGHVLLEWTFHRVNLSLDLDLSTKAGEWCAIDLDSPTNAGDAETLDLRSRIQWVRLQVTTVAWMDRAEEANAERKAQGTKLAESPSNDMNDVK
ncbi:hypothetical protein [Singulisphaera sp. PoT]|uniref:hypothetical protein n=1 Tax=Singulisphaera sp. PoT TaxID=3411797 RepID=UPI003BF56232